MIVHARLFLYLKVLKNINTLIQFYTKNNREFSTYTLISFLLIFTVIGDCTNIRYFRGKLEPPLCDFK